MSVRKFRVCAAAVAIVAITATTASADPVVLYSNFGSAPGGTVLLLATGLAGIVRARRVRLTGDGSSRSVRVAESARWGKAGSK